VPIAATIYKMKKTPNWVLLFLLMILPSAYTQQSGIVDGRLVNLTDPSIIAGRVELEVIELGGGMSIIQSATSDASGKFHIEGLPQDHRLMVRANYKGANYHAQLEFTGGKARVEIGVYEPTTSMKDIEVEGVQMAFQLAGDQLKALETMTFNNKTKPPRTFTIPEGTFRISKPPGIIEPPKMRVTAPGASMPLVQSALESADGKSYYTLYPLRPGITRFEVEQLLPYANKRYTYVKKFYQDIASIDFGVIPHDVVASGKGLSRIQTDPQKNFSVYTSIPVKSGTEVVWEFSGGTAVPEAESPGAAAEPEVTAMPNGIGRNTLLIGPLLLMGFIVVLWYAYGRSQKGSRGAADFRLRQIRDRREQLLNSIADLDHRYETQSLGEQEYGKQREESKRRLRKIFLLSKTR
jgi:hypothetical protein